VIDGYQTLAGDRILVRANTSATTNGIYNAQLGAWTLAIDFNGDSNVVQGTQTLITNGSLYANAIFAVATPNPIIVGVTPITFTQFTAAAPTVATLPITSGQAKRAIITSGYTLETFEANVPADTSNSQNIAYSDAFWPVGGAIWALVQSTLGLTSAQIAAIQSTAQTNR
jgi:hypothetical protein